MLYRPQSCHLPNTALNIYSSCLYLIHSITITIQKNLLCVTQFQLFSAHFSIHYSIQSVTVMQPDRSQHTPRPCNFVSKKFLKPMSINPLAYTAACEAAGLARSINTQPAVRRNSETNPTSQHNRGMY